MSEHLHHVAEPPKRIFGNLLIDGPDGQCAYIYSGIEERCQRDAVAYTFMDTGSGQTRVEMCAEHSREEVPEPPSTEQKKIATDGGQPAGTCWLGRGTWLKDRRHFGDSIGVITGVAQEDRGLSARLRIMWRNPHSYQNLSVRAALQHFKNGDWRVDHA